MDPAAYERDADWCVEYHYACTRLGFDHLDATEFADAMLADDPPGEAPLPTIPDHVLGWFWFQLNEFRAGVEA